MPIAFMRIDQANVFCIFAFLSLLLYNIGLTLSVLFVGGLMRWMVI